MNYTTIAQLLAAGHDAAPALAAPGRRPMTHAQLRDLVDDTAVALNRRGIGRNDRVGILLPGGPEAASAIVAVGAGATVAPLDPGIAADELAACCEQLRLVAVVVADGTDSGAATRAGELGLQVLKAVVPGDAPAGAFELAGGDATGEKRLEAPPEDDGADTFRNKMALAEPRDIAAVLRVASSQGPVRIVPLTHRNVCASSRHVAETLQLGTDDRCLNVMPLFDAHGIVAAVLASLGAGGSVFCTPGFEAARFRGWLEEGRPTWFTGEAATLAAILEESGDQTAPDDLDLRCVRSASAPLPADLMGAAEDHFRAPVLEAYGKAEAAHQITSNPLPPAPRKAGSVGPAAGPEVAVVDDNGRPLDAGEPGEVLVRGANVVSGYEGDPEANAAAFSNGWFHTGDRGRLDEDGYLTLLEHEPGE